MNARAAVLRWAGQHLGIVETDPDHQDAIPLPLYELVFHDAVVTAATPNNLRALLHGNAPPRRAAQAGRAAGDDQSRISECGSHAERTTFADGTTLTVDWGTSTVEIQVGRAILPAAAF